MGSSWDNLYSGTYISPVHWDLYDLASTIRCTSPKLSMRTNTAFTSIFDDITAGFSEYLGVDKGIDKAPLGRAGIFLGSAHLHWASTYYSHEVAHSQVAYNYGSSGFGSLDYSDWRMTVPHWRHPSIGSGGIRSTVSGLNQQQLNSDFYFRKVVISGQMSLDDAYSYIFNNFADLAYHATFGESTSGDIMSVQRKQKMNYGFSWEKRDWLALSALTAFGSSRSWESAALMVNYLRNGARSQKALSFNVVGSMELFPPNISLYLTTRSYMPIIGTPVKFKNGTVLSLNIGTPLQFFADPYRIGAEVFLPLKSGEPESYNVSFEANLNADKNGLYGFMAGMRSGYQVNEKLRFNFMAELYKEDLIYENVMGYGAHVSSGNPLAGYAIKATLSGRL